MSSTTTAIQWTDATWNPVRGCSVVSEGCKNCYAMHVAARFNEPGMAYEGLALRKPARWTGDVRVIADTLDAPSHWRKPRRIFVNSMSDLFHEALSFEQIADVFRVMAYPECGRHTFQVLTKRAERMREFFAWAATLPKVSPWPDPDVVLSNVWLGVSVENQARADERIPHLLATPAAVRFLSVEPLLGPVRPILAHGEYDLTAGVDLRTGRTVGPSGTITMRCIDWVIVGGESGPGARPCDVAWIRALVEQCREAGVACFVKQFGAKAVRGETSLALRDKKGGDPEEWFHDLRVREFPQVRA